MADPQQQQEQGQHKPQEPRHSVILHLIRHGEAAHNILEKQAKQQAKEEAIAQGYSENSLEVKEKMEEARKSVLDNDALFDAPLSDAGKEEAQKARRIIDKLVQEQGLPRPTEILVSPLQRALQTADICFPDCHDIHVRQELQERQTGKACDTRQPSHSISTRESFQRFSFSRLRLASIEKIQLPSLEDLFGRYSVASASTTRQSTSSAGSIQEEEEWFQTDIAAEADANKKEEETTSANKDEETVEDKATLRMRTRKLFNLLRESQAEAIGVVTHKGYLRELERGPFGQADATEFQNCEVRVYKVTFPSDHPSPHEIAEIERIH